MMDTQFQTTGTVEFDSLGDRVVTALPAALLERYDFFELYPPDVIGEPDAAFGERVKRAGYRMELGGELPRLDWGQYERWRTAEKTCVLNRCYFIASLARYAKLGGDVEMSRVIVETMLHFIRSCPPPDSPQAVVDHIRRARHRCHHDYNLKTFDQIQQDETDIEYIWFDFQPASRLMHFIHALYFLRDLDVWTAAELGEIRRSLYEHAEVIYHGERSLPLEIGDNHQSTRAAALMLGAAYFQGVGQWRQFAAEAARIIEFHSAHSFFPDGVLKEISASYHTSVTWHVRDCCLLARQLGLALPAHLEAQLRRATAYIQAMTSPTGRTVLINDGRQVTPTAWLQSMAPFSSSGSCEESAFFPDAGIAVFRHPRLFLVIDASVFTGVISHYQGGKNGFTLWLDGQPFFVDSGCPDLYDDEWFSSWYKQPQAHSTLLVDGEGDSRLKGFTEFTSHATIVCSGWQKHPEGSWFIECQHTSTEPAWSGVRWTRTFTITPGLELDIHDIVRSPRPVQLTFIFNLHHDVTARPDRNACLLHHGGTAARMTFVSGKPVDLTIADGKNFLDGGHHATRQLHVGVTGTTAIELRTSIRVSR